MSTSPNLKSIPSDETITATANLQVLDKDGGKIQFGTLFEGEKTIVVFISTSLPHLSAELPSLQSTLLLMTVGR